MIRLVATAIDPVTVPIPDPDGSVLDVVMLQAHTGAAIIWGLLTVPLAVLAVPALRRIPSPSLLGALQTRRGLLLNALWAAFVFTLGTGTYLLIEQAIYDPPVSASDFDELEALPYGLPYYYALYAKIGIFLIMGVASLLLAVAAKGADLRAESEVASAADQIPDWVEEEVEPEAAGAAPVDVTSGATETSGAVQVAERSPAPAVPATGLWGSVAVIVAGFGGIGLCVTLIKYFHELSQAATVYERLRGR